MVLSRCIFVTGNSFLSVTYGLLVSFSSGAFANRAAIDLWVRNDLRS